MNIELKNVRIYNGMSEETTCFQGEVFVDGIRIGSVKNDGHGGSNTYYWSDIDRGREVEKFADSLSLTWDDGQPIEVEKLDFYLWRLIDEMATNVNGTGHEVTVFS